MTSYEKGQEVKITGGKYEGCKAWFNGLSGGSGQHCFVWLGGGSNLCGARVKLADIAPAGQGV